MDPIPEPRIARVPIAGRDERFPVHRIYCVGRNYADHAREMGTAVDREQPVFFLKSPTCLWTDATPLPYPPATRDLHHEVELVVALGRGGSDIPADAALRHVFGYALGLDLTRRDLQAIAKAKSLPWDSAKNFEAAAPIGAIRPSHGAWHPAAGTLTLEVDGAVRQRGDIADMIHTVPEIIAALSQLFTLVPGDLIYTGTPAGVGPLVRGSRFHARFEGLPDLFGDVA